MKKYRKKLKSTLQISQTECGLCCVRTILEAYDYQVSMAELRQIREPGRDGLGIQQIKDMLLHFEMDAKVYRMKKIEALTVINFPIIAYWKNCHYICVESYSKDKVTIMDPAIGRMTISQAEFVEAFSGYIIVACPKNTFKKHKTSNFLRWKKRYIWPMNMIALYIKVALASSALVGITLAVPLITQYFIDTEYSRINSFAEALIYLLMIAVTMMLIAFFKTEISIKMIYRFSWHLLNGAFSRVLELPAKYFTVRSPGEIVYRLNSLTRIQDILGTKLVQLLLDLISSITLLGYVMYISISLGVFVFGLTLLFLLALIVAQPFVSAATDIELHEGSKAQSIQLDAIVSINSVKLGGYVQAYLKDWEESFKKLLNALSKRIRIQQGIMGSILLGMQAFSPLIVLVISLYMESKGIVSLGEAVAVQAVTSLLFSYVNSVFSTLTDSLIAGRYVELAEDIFEYPVEESRGSVKEMKSGDIVIENATFRYTPDSEAAVKNISLDIRDGETVAFVGVSGSGKTTLGKVICSLFEPTEGKVYYGGVEYRDYKLDALREAISYIPQEAYLHNRTIMENLKLGSKCTEEEIQEFCEKLQFLDFIKKLPMGYNTVISEMGANLSGGQRQRIHIARVLLQNPRLLVMDEATSSLDNVSQSQVYEELMKLKCTKIVIAHRLLTVQNADRIIVLENGTIVQVGNHEKLVSVEGAYAKLFKAENERNM